LHRFRLRKVKHLSEKDVVEIWPIKQRWPRARSSGVSALTHFLNVSDNTGIMGSHGRKWRRAFYLTASVLILFAARPMCGGDVCCRCVLSHDPGAHCQNTTDSIPCDCPACACRGMTPFATSIDTYELRSPQDNVALARRGTTELPSADTLADASLHAPQPATALQRCVRFSRLTL
jgi:hypothetical protein